MCMQQQMVGESKHKACIVDVLKTMQSKIFIPRFILVFIETWAMYLINNCR